MFRGFFLSPPSAGYAPAAVANGDPAETLQPFLQKTFRAHFKAALPFSAKALGKSRSQIRQNGELVHLRIGLLVLEIFVTGQGHSMAPQARSQP